MKRCNGCGQTVQTEMTHHYIQSGHVTRNNDLGGSASFPPLVLCGELVPIMKAKRIGNIHEGEKP